MSEAMNVIMAGQSGDYLELASGNRKYEVKGRLFKKQVLHFGSFQHPSVPGKKITIDENVAKQLVKNFKDGVCDIVQVPIVDAQNRHVEDPDRNIGRVVDVDYDSKGVYAYIDARKRADDLGSTLIGASAFMNLNHTNTTTGEKVGATLLHVAVTNRPYITKLEDFTEELISASDTSSDEATILLGADSEVIDQTVSSEAADNQENDMPKTLEELFAALKAEHNIDVADLQAKAAKVETVETEKAALSASLSEKETELAAASATAAELTTALSAATPADGELSLSDVTEALVELSAKVEERDALIAEISADRDALKLSAAEAEIDSLISEGRILPAKREKMLELSMKDRDMFEAILPDTSIVSLSEDGVTTHEATNAKTISESERIISQYIKKTK